MKIRFSQKLLESICGYLLVIIVALFVAMMTVLTKGILLWFGAVIMVMVLGLKYWVGKIDP